MVHLKLYIVEEENNRIVLEFVKIEKREGKFVLLRNVNDEYQVDYNIKNVPFSDFDKAFDFAQKRKEKEEKEKEKKTITDGKNMKRKRIQTKKTWNSSRNSISNVEYQGILELENNRNKKKLKKNK